MRFGLALPQYGFSLAGGAEADFGVTASWALRAEALGFDSVWLSDHFFYSFGRYGADKSPISALEPMTSLAGLAAITSKVRLGTLVLCAPFRTAAVTAKMAATIDAISGGRFDLGLGAGWMDTEFEAFGYRFGTVGERFAGLERTLAVLSALGAPGPVTDEALGLRGARLLPRPVHGRVPMWLGGKGGPRLLDLAARYADGWNTAWRVDSGAYEERVRAARQACVAAGRDPATFRFSVGLYSIVGESEADARDAFERAKAMFPGDSMAAETWESWRADTLSGSPEQAAERVRRLEALGVEEIIISPWVLPFAIHEPELVETFARLLIG